MCQHDLRRTALCQGSGETGGIGVAEMALGPQDALLQIVGIGAAAEGLDVVIGLQHRQVHPQQGVGGLVGDIAGVRQDAHGTVLRVQPEAAGARRVMGGGDRRHGAFPDGPGAAEVQRLQPRLHGRQPPGQLPARPLCGEDRGIAALQQRLQAGDVVRMGVGDEDGRETARLQAQFPQGGGDASAGDAGVQQDPALSAGKQQRVPGGTTGQRMYNGQKAYLFRRKMRRPQGRPSTKVATLHRGRRIADR